MMIRDNKIGYLSTFVKYIFQVVHNEKAVIDLYNRLLSIGSLSSKLRDINGNLKNVIEFENINDLDRAIDRVLAWQKVNNFIRGFPPKQKTLIWKNGYYTDEVKNISDFLTNNIIDIIDSNEKKNIFLRKISSVKDKDSLVNLISRISKDEPWEYDYWLNKLKSTRNVLVTWSSKEEKQIICLVFTHSAIKKIAYMTNWCIVDKMVTFYQYLNIGYQFILYDFTENQNSYDAVVGFTTDLEYKIKHSYDRKDHSIYLPDKFGDAVRDKNYNYCRMLKEEYRKINLKEALMRLQPVVIPLFRRKIGDTIKNSKYINNFLNWYN